MKAGGSHSQQHAAASKTTFRIPMSILWRQHAAVRKNLLYGQLARKRASHIRGGAPAIGLVSADAERSRVSDSTMTDRRHRGERAPARPFATFLLTCRQESLIPSYPSSIRFAGPRLLQLVDSMGAPAELEKLRCTTARHQAGAGHSCGWRGARSTRRE